MNLHEITMDIGMGGWPRDCNMLSRLGTAVCNQYHQDEIVRFAVVSSDGGTWHCELGVVDSWKHGPVARPESIFNFNQRSHENTDTFNAVLIVPTGIGCEIGGHAGDAGPVARLLASACDTLITHPNVVNASDINELPENGLYVEGSVLARLLMGTVGLQRVRSNRVLLVVHDHEDRQITDITINAASAARATLGMECQVIHMNRLSMVSEYTASGRASGVVEGLEHLLGVLADHRRGYDAVALASIINVPESYHCDYYTSAGGMINPWGGVEALLTHAISMLLEVPSAHAPMVEYGEILRIELGIVDPRMAAEVMSSVFLHCVLKGLYRSPRLTTDPRFFHVPGVLSASDVSCLVIPDGCLGLPTLAALQQGIPVIAVEENRNLMRNHLPALPFKPGKLFIVDNYLEAVGVVTALKAGVDAATVRRPMLPTVLWPSGKFEKGGKK